MVQKRREIVFEGRERTFGERICGGALELRGVGHPAEEVWREVEKLFRKNRSASCASEGRGERQHGC